MNRRYARWVLACGVIWMVAGTAMAQRPDPLQSAQRIDQQLDDELRAVGGSLNPAPLADDETYLRRVFLDIIGHPPTVDDVLAFNFQSDPDKRDRIVQKLLDDEDFGDNWARYWRDAIFYRRSEDRALVAAGTATEYLKQAFNDNQSWDQIARSLITAEGDVLENGATALIMAQAGRPEETVAEISRLFCGIQIQCAQCHDHPTDEWTREQFHQLAAFFPRVAVRPDNSDDRRTFLVTVTDSRFQLRGNNNNRFRGTPEHRMPDLYDPQAAGQVMQPAFFVDGRELPLGTKDADRRGALADWLTSVENPWFARAYVNRMWSELVGEGFYEPVDDLGPDRDGVAPQTLQLLVDDFVASGHDPKWLMRTILATQTYQRESRVRRSSDQLPFQANVAQRLRGDQLYNCLLSALDVEPPSAPRRSGPYGGGRDAQFQFNQVFGYDPSDRRDEVAGSIPQTLAMMNAVYVNRAIQAMPRTSLGRLLAETPDDRVAVTTLYLRTLSRSPTDAELTGCLRYLKSVGNRNEAYEDLLWALINSTEFLFRS